MNPVTALEVLKELHEPYLPRLVGIADNSTAWNVREPTLDEQANAVELWCDACRLPAARCVQYPFIVEALTTQ